MKTGRAGSVAVLSSAEIAISWSVCQICVNVEDPSKQLSIVKREGKMFNDATSKACCRYLSTVIDTRRRR